MATVRNLDNGFTLTEWTDEINNLDHVYNFFTGINLFNTKNITQTTVSFDKNMNDTTLLPDSNRRERDASKGKERTSETFVLPLGYFKHQDAITTEDIQGIKAAGTEGEPEAWANVRLEKLMDMNARVQLTHEYMMMKAAQGISVTPQGTVLANMFTEFGVTQDSIDFLLGTPTTNVDAKISELKEKVQGNLQTGSLAGRIQVIVDRSFFDKLRNHATIRQAYLYYQNSGPQRLRDDLASYFKWGITESFVHNGVEFLTYNALFKKPDGTTEAATAANSGYTILPGARDMYRGYFGPANKIHAANQLGKKMFAYEYSDPRDEFYDLEVETAPLFIVSQPKAVVAVITSN